MLKHKYHMLADYNILYVLYDIVLLFIIQYTYKEYNIMFKIQVDKFGAAEQDCSLSLSLDPTYIKALQRRMTARIGINIFYILDTTYIKALQNRYLF